MRQVIPEERTRQREGGVEVIRRPERGRPRGDMGG